ncbi:hypothetical protein E2I00_011032 [Balaenoptera physalus]|uniref:Galactokinase n=1 Tax=Balaenoptera physalus TaxID=9770 RepID=A0A643BYD2_BALPH|nr:hypothetical protein E2I00_011032 [Balaenoptera physalus]
MFNSKFGSVPKFYVRAPGRVNIIGEHIDYCGYSVLPMAVEQDMLIAVEPVKTHVLQLANTNPLYLDFSTSANNIQIDKTKPLWHNYFLCGFKGIQEHFGLSDVTGMNCLVDGNIPPSSGLSSSSALVCCAGLVTLTVLGMNLSKVRAKTNGLLAKRVTPAFTTGVELAEICAKSEHYIGTEGGGMDQSISFLAEEGTAKLIEFSPLRATDVKLPSGAVFVIANSCVEMNKAATSHFNIRVMECRLAAKSSSLCQDAGVEYPRTLLAKHKCLPWEEVLRLEEVQAKLGVSLEEMLLITEDALHSEPYSPEEICRCLGISLQELKTQILSPDTQDGHPCVLTISFRETVHASGKEERDIYSPNNSNPIDSDSVVADGGILVVFGYTTAMATEQYPKEAVGIAALCSYGTWLVIVTGWSLLIGVVVIMEITRDPLHQLSHCSARLKMNVLSFKLYQRAKHVYSEAARVLQFKKICEEAPDNTVQLLGELMNQSHVSCRDMYECSCPELDQLVDICRFKAFMLETLVVTLSRKFGAQGSRLTGAGWGGCTVSIVPADKLPSFLANVHEAYYQRSNRSLVPEKQSLFATKPGGLIFAYV